MMHSRLFRMYLLFVGLFLVANGNQANPGVVAKATTQGLNAGKRY